MPTLAGKEKFPPPTFEPKLPALTLPALIEDAAPVKATTCLLPSGKTKPALANEVLDAKVTKPSLRTTKTGVDPSDETIFNPFLVVEVSALLMKSLELPSDDMLTPKFPAPSVCKVAQALSPTPQEPGPIAKIVFIPKNAAKTAVAEIVINKIFFAVILNLLI